MYQNLTKLFLAGVVAAFCAVIGTPAAFAQKPPKSVLVTVNIGSEEKPITRSLMVIDTETDETWNFPFIEMNNTSGADTAPKGAPEHAALHPNRRWVYVTMTGSDKLAMRLLVIDLGLGWEGGKPVPTITKSLTLLAKGNGFQQGHGTRMTKDGKFLLFSELHNDRLRVFDTENKKFIGPGGSYSHKSLKKKKPHGAWPNPSSTIAVVPQYEYGGDAVPVWTMDPESGALKFKKTITLTDGDVRGAFTHTVAWRDENEFYISATHDTSEDPVNTFEPSVFLVNLSEGTTKAVLKKWDGNDESSGVKEGVSDVVIANGNLYVCEGHVYKNIPPGAGYVSVWKIAGNGSLTFVTRIGANTGLPASFKQCHGLFGSQKGKWVYAQSFISNLLVKISTKTNWPTKIWDADVLDVPHGIYVN